MRRLLDDASGEGVSHADNGAHSAALPRGPNRAQGAGLAYTIGHCDAGRSPGAAPSWGAGGQTHLWALGQVGQSHGSMDLSPALPLLLASAPLLLSEPHNQEIHKVQLIHECLARITFNKYIFIGK